VGEALVEKIVAEREAQGPFATVYDFVRRVDPSVLNRRTMESLIKAGAFDSLGVARLGFLLKVDELIETTLSRRKDLSLGISTLFAAIDGDGANDWEGTDVPISDVEFDQPVKLDFEREMLGTYISDHPLYAVEHVLATKTDGTLVSLREQADDLAKTNRPFKIGGIFSEVQLRTTKDGRAYARTVVEDLGGSVEVNFSSKVFEKCSGYLAKDNIVIVKVRVDVRDEEPRFGAMDVEVLHLNQGDGELRLSFRPEDFTSTAIAKLKEILQRYPGPSSVVLETGLDGKAFKLGPDFRVTISSVVGDLRSEFGRNVIKA
jgi:DNA polymerase-3 subunit alpha